MGGNQPKHEGHGALVSEIRASPDVAALLRLVLECVDEASTPKSLVRGDTGQREVLLEVQLDGARYRLIRFHPHRAGPPVSLSPREKEIVRLIIKGLPNKAIAAVLDISPWTVATHLRRVFAKLGVGSRAEMVARVLRAGLLEI